ncbi:MAG: metallophosphoesterase [Candidatus Omnitrophota bacterium]
MLKRYISKKIIQTLLLSCICGILCISQVLAGDIVIYGDSQFSNDAQRKVVRAILECKPAIVFRVGDLTADGRSLKQWETFHKINDKLIQSSEYFPALGNHEYNSALYFSNFNLALDKRWYSVQRQGIHFIVLDSNSSLDKDSEQYKWLERDLSNVGKDIKFRIALFHHPLFDTGWHKEDEKGLKPVLIPLFEKYGVSVVFSGHDHNYQRFRYNGIFYIITGGGGAPLYGRLRKSSYLEKFALAYHFCLLSVTDNVLKIKVLDTKLQVLDEFDIKEKVYSR